MLRSRPVLWLAILLFPPLGLVLLWMRRDTLVLKIAETVAVLAIAAVELVYVYGFRIVWNGNMDHVIAWGFHMKARHDAVLEASRAKQEPLPQPEPPPPAPEPEPAPAEPVEVKPQVPARPVSYWTDFRGPHRDGVYSEGEITTDWPLKMLWKEPVGGGYASISFGEGLAYTIEQRRGNETIAAYNPETGREIWIYAYPASFDEVLGGPGPRATPVFYDGLLYSLGAQGDLYCITAHTGNPKWKKNILK